MKCGSSKFFIRMKLWPFRVRPEVHLGHSLVSLIVGCGGLGKEPGVLLWYFCTFFFHICGLELLGQEVAFVFVLTFLRGPFLCSHSHGLFIAFYSSHFLTCKRNSSLFLKTPGIRKSRSLNFFQNSRLVHLTAIIAIGYYKNYLCIYFEKHLFII